jgi:hypothetical protein
VADDRHETTLQIQIQCKLNLMVMVWISYANLLSYSEF